MWRTIRTCLRLILVTGLMFWHYLLLDIGRALSRTPDAARAWRTAQLRAWARHTARVIGMNHSIIGEPPAAPYFLVFNHLSYLDVLLLLAYIYHPMVCARHDFASWPVIGFIARRIGAIWVHRANFNAMPAVTQAMSAAMSAGYGVAIAPEATTTRGDQVYPFHSTLLEPAAKLGIPVHYCSLRYETGPNDQPASNIVNWWEHMSFFAHGWRLLHADHVHGTIHFGAEPILETNRKVLARSLRDAVAAIYQPM